MAESTISVAQDEFLCAVCLDLLKDPVTVPCGHSFCRICISGFWDQERVSRCPQCRKTFSSRPALAKNIIIAEMMEKLKKSRAQAAGAAQSPAGPGDVECDLCPGAKIKAVKSCLVCLNSYCQTHFERHQEFNPGKRHTVIEATGRLQEMICPRHEKLLEIFCRTDQCCVCYLCVVEEHKTHDTVSVGAERAEKQKQLEETQRSVRQRIQERQKELEELKEGIEAHKKISSWRVFLKNSVFFSETLLLICSSRDSLCVLIEGLSEGGPDAVDEAHCVRDAVERENSCSSIHIDSYSRAAGGSGEFIPPPSKSGLPDSLSPEPEGSGERESGRPLLLGGAGGVFISVSYKSIGRKGWSDECLFGRNSESWSLFWSPKSFLFIFNKKATELPGASSGSRIGVYVDRGAGILSFYSVSHTMSLIHSIRTSFTEPLYPGFWLGRSSRVKICDLKVEAPDPERTRDQQFMVELKGRSALDAPLPCTLSGERTPRDSSSHAAPSFVCSRPDVSANQLRARGPDWPIRGGDQSGNTHYAECMIPEKVIPLRFKGAHAVSKPLKNSRERRGCSRFEASVQPSLVLLSGPLDHGFWRAVEEDEFGVHVLLQVQLARLSHQEDVGAEFEDAVHVGKLFEHDGVGDPTEELTNELPDDQNHR
ncbi:hypothetical protein DNTS_032673, partial [Danionella cerebrum]